MPVLVVKVPGLFMLVWEIKRVFKDVILLGFYLVIIINAEHASEPLVLKRFPSIRYYLLLHRLSRNEFMVKYWNTTKRRSDLQALLLPAISIRN